MGCSDISVEMMKLEYAFVFKTTEIFNNTSYSVFRKIFS